MNKLFMPINHMDKLYNSKNLLVKYFHNKRLNEIINLLPKNRSKVLDAGCGEGHLLQKIEHCHDCTGIDIIPIAIEQAKKRCKKAEVVLGDILETNFPKEFFDIVIATEVLEHIPEYKKAVEELKRVLKPKGLLIVSFPNETNFTIARALLLRKPFRVPDHCNSFNPKLVGWLVGSKTVLQKNIPNLPFWGCLACVMMFKKLEKR